MNQSQRQELGYQAQVECFTNFRRSKVILETGIFTREHSRNPLVQSAFVDFIIILRDLLAKCGKYANRINFEDDVLKSESVKDITDAVTAVRDACCHIDSHKHVFDVEGNIRVSFMVIYGGGTGFLAISSPEKELGCDYADDVAFIFGPNRLYLHRHLRRALEEARMQLLPLMPRFAEIV